MPYSRRWPPAASGRGCVKTKLHLAVNRFWEIDITNFRSSEPRWGFLALLGDLEKAPDVFTQPRSRPGIDRIGQLLNYGHSPRLNTCSEAAVQSKGPVGQGWVFRKHYPLRDSEDPERPFAWQAPIKHSRRPAKCQDAWHRPGL